MGIDKELLRFRCIEMAVASSGEDVAYEYVVEAAQAYVDFIVGKKPALRVVSNDD